MKNNPPSKKFTHLDTIEIINANANNLKNISLSLPKNKLIAVTGVSGSGKSTLTIDTLFAEGQRRYVESLSSYARQFLMRMKKPEVEAIKGICPAIAIEQKVTSTNSRSTVGSLTEIYDYLRMLYARIGTTYSPISGNEVKKHSTKDVLEHLQSYEDGEKLLLLAPLKLREDTPLKLSLEKSLEKGFVRLFNNDKVSKIEQVIEDLDSLTSNQPIFVVIDRLITKSEDAFWNRVADSIQTAFSEGEGECYTYNLSNKINTSFNNKFELDGMSFLAPTHQLFNYNNPYGACTTCEGYGQTIGIDPDKVIPNKNKSIFEGAVQPWSGEKGREWVDRLAKVAHLFDFPIHRSYKHLTPEEQALVWKGNKHFEGIDAYFSELEKKSYKIQNRVMLSRYRGKTKCTSCEGKRLRPEAQYVKINNHSIGDIFFKPVDQLHEFLSTLPLSKTDTIIAERILEELLLRLSLMKKVGLSYLSLDRLASTLSGGETQRINLIRTLGSNLTDSMYILDEPSIGLHPKDSLKLLEVLKSLRDLGNTVIVVEHEEDIITNADHLLDIGPRAGVHGGEVIYNGSLSEIDNFKGDSLTIDYLNNKRVIAPPKVTRSPNNWISIKGATQHNLKNIDVDIPLNAFTVVSGVSGSGKTTLIKKILYPYLCRTLGINNTEKPGLFETIEGDLQLITHVEMVSQNPIGKSSRSNPVTYVKAYDDIRKLFAEQYIAKLNGFLPKHFSFNVDAGRCETCKGEGSVTVEMQFLADVHLECEVCEGRRFKKEVLAVEYQYKNINDVLDLTIDEALDFFYDQKSIVKKIQPLQDVGLGYIKLGQASSTLSGGEAQRVKLASFLAKENTSEKILFIFDEPTTGLHFHDIKVLLKAMNALIEKGHSVLVIEHNLDVIKSADWMVDLGPEGGDNGGGLMFQGLPIDSINHNKSITGQFLKDKF